VWTDRYIVSFLDVNSVDRSIYSFFFGCGINDYRKDKNKPLSSSSINDKFPLCYSMPVKDINTKSSCNKQKFAV